MPSPADWQQMPSTQARDRHSLFDLQPTPSGERMGSTGGPGGWFGDGASGPEGRLPGASTLPPPPPPPPSTSTSARFTTLVGPHAGTPTPANRARPTTSTSHPG